MAIGFRAIGAATKVDTSVTGTSPTVAMPAGHTTNDLLTLSVFTDNNTAPATPAGWTQLFYLSAGTSANSPYQGWSHFSFFYRIDNGALGSSVTLSLDSSPWPTGLPTFSRGYPPGPDATRPVRSESGAHRPRRAAPPHRPTRPSPLPWPTAG
jgi:hypothetical protein